MFLNTSQKYKIIDENWRFFQNSSINGWDNTYNYRFEFFGDVHEKNRKNSYNFCPSGFLSCSCKGIGVLYSETFMKTGTVFIVFCLFSYV